MVELTTKRAATVGSILYADAGGSALFGLGGFDRLVGSAANDVFNETATPGSAARPSIYGRGGVDQVYANGSYPIFVTQDLLREGVVRFVPGGDGPSQLALLGPTQGLLALGVQELRFLDGSVSYGPDAPAARITRLYLAALGRSPDGGGLAGYVNHLIAGVPLGTLASAMLSGPEATARLGGTDAAGFVTAVYRSALGRAPEAAALTELTRQLSSGTSRATVLTGISESVESQAWSGTGAGTSTFVPDENVAAIARLYDTVLGRLPDAAGLKAWGGSLTDFTFSSFRLPANFQLAAIAGGFERSPEFRQLFGTPDNASLVQITYRNSVGRAPTAAEQSFWEEGLNRGPDARGGVLLGISESAEHKALLAPRIEQGGIVTRG